MKFGAVPVKEALGATAVHSIRKGDLVLKKGTLIGPKEVAALERPDIVIFVSTASTPTAAMPRCSRRSACST